MGTYKDLDVYKRSFQAAITTYQITLSFPQYLKFDIVDDIRRAARSIPSNIAEGYGRNKSSADIKNFLRTALGSCDEVLFNYEFIFALNLMRKDEFHRMESEYKIIGVSLRRLIDSLKTEKTKKTQ